MHYDSNYKENLDLAALTVEILRKWKWLVAAVLLGAILFGGYVLLRPGEVVLSSEPTEDAEQLEEDLQTALDTLEANESTIKRNKESITSNEDMVDDCQNSQTRLESCLDLLWQELQDAKSGDDASSDGQSLSLSQMLNMMDSITELDNQMMERLQQEKDVRDKIASLQSEINSLTMQNKSLERSIDRMRTEEEDAEEEEVVVRVAPSKRRALLFAIIGALLGVVCVCGVVFLVFFTDRKMRTSKELRARYQLTIFGEFSSDKAKKHKGVEKKLDELVGDVQTAPTDEQVYELISAGICNLVKEPVRLALTGTVDMATLEDVCKKLSPLMPSGYEVAAKENPVYNAAFLSELSQYSIILVEAKGASEKSEIAKLAELLYANEAEVLGAVVK